MPRLESVARAGFYPFPDDQLDAVASLVAPGQGRLLDPCAGQGVALDHLARVWGLTPYANELDADNADACIAKFGARQALQGDLYRLIASHGAFNVLWVNPPYSENISGDEKRLEFDVLKHAWKWAQQGGLVFWVVFRQHVTAKAAGWLSRHCASVDVWGVPGRYLDEYDQVVVVCRVGQPGDESALMTSILAQNENPRALERLSMPEYTLPVPREFKRLIFAPDLISDRLAESLVNEAGVQHMAAFQALVQPAPQTDTLQPIVQPRGGQMALVLASGLFNGLVIQTDQGKRAIKGSLTIKESLANVSTIGEGDDATTRETYKIMPQATVTLLDEQGGVTDISGDTALIDFIQRYRAPLLNYFAQVYPPLYDFKLGDLASTLGGVRIKDNPLYSTQKHVVAACQRALERRKGVVIVGEMGTGKTAMTGSLLLTLRTHVKPGQVNLIMCPPHLIDKWASELRMIDPTMHIARLKRIADVRALMDKATALPANILKVGLIPREMAKLGEGWSPAVVWRKTARRAQPGAPLDITRVPTCPTCGELITYKLRGAAMVASEVWLAKSKRLCACGGALWQDVRTFSKPKPGHKYPSKNPRMALADYIAQVFPNRIYAFIADELHELKAADAGQGAAFLTLAQKATKIIGLTGTLYGGVASSLYFIEFAFNPRVRRFYPWGAGGLAQWVREMGVLEKIVEHRPEYDSTGRHTGVRTSIQQPREAPGASPLLVREILDHCVFVSLADFGKVLPPLEEIPVGVPLDTDMKLIYDTAKEEMGDYLFQQRMNGDFSFASTYLQALLSYGGAAWRGERVVHKIRLDRDNPKDVYERHVHTIPPLPVERIYPKEQALIELLREELADGRRCTVFLRQTGTRDLQPRLERLIREHVPDARPYVLRSTVQAEKRDALIQKQVQAGTNVLICNPVLVQTGLDLLDFTRLIFYEVLYSLYTMGQSSRRHWRLNQTQDCKTFYLYYEDTMEARAVSIVAKKQKASGLLYGDLGGGLTDLIDGGDGDLLSELIENLDDDSVTDLRALFQRHAQDSAGVWDSVPDEPLPSAPALTPVPPRENFTQLTLF